jgi:hypothetical protein
MTPRKPRFMACVMCRAQMEPTRSTKTFCSAACRQRAYRRRRDGLPERFLSEGAAPSGRFSLRQRRQRIRRILDLIEAGIEPTQDDWTWRSW